MVPDNDVVTWTGTASWFQSSYHPAACTQRTARGAERVTLSCLRRSTSSMLESSLLAATETSHQAKRAGTNGQRNADEPVRYPRSRRERETVLAPRSIEWCFGDLGLGCPSFRVRDAADAARTGRAMRDGSAEMASRWVMNASDGQYYRRARNFIDRTVPAATSE